MNTNPQDFIVNTPHDDFITQMQQRVIWNFSLFHLGIGILTIPSSFFANDPFTLYINIIACLFDFVPILLIVLFKRYRSAAQMLIVVAMCATIFNAIASNMDISIVTVVWYFVIIVFAHLVLGLNWSVSAAAVSFGSVTAFAILRILNLNLINPNLLDRNIFIGSPIALLISFAALLYLLIIYTRIHKVMFRQILQSDKEKSQYLGIMTHDIRNYLGSITVISEYMRSEFEHCTDKGFTIESLKNLDLLDQASSSVLSMVNEIVDASQDIVLTKEIYVEEEEITQFVAPILQRYQLIAKEKGINFIISADSDKAFVAINRDKFSRVIENLLSNAVKFSNKGDTVTFYVNAAYGKVLITIADTGIGIPAELLDTVYEPFSKAGRAGTADEKSTGLGLSIVKKLVELHHGTIRIESKAGKGTKVFVELTAVNRRVNLNTTIEE